MALTQIKEAKSTTEDYLEKETIQAFVKKNEEKAKTLYDILSDKDNKDLITLEDERGEDIIFKQLAVIPMGEVVYCILKPVFGGSFNAGEAIAFRLRELSNGEEALTVVTDKIRSIKIFLQYYKMIAGAVEQGNASDEEKNEKIRLINSLSEYYTMELKRLEQ
ncbi:MAG: hypothetical protein IJZ04_07790 [Clostridia bacterium]|nr:hypothetical protein [Clostridia bacterium]